MTPNFFDRYKLGLKNDRPDWRDLAYVNSGQPLRPSVDLRQWASPIEDQLGLGSCASNAMVGAYELLTIKEFPDQYVDLSRLFIYYNSRELDNSVMTDSGAYLRDTMKAVKKYGVCSEELWPYDIDKFAAKPYDICYVDARKRNIKNYYRITNIDDMMDALNNNLPVTFGMIIYMSFYNIDETNNTVKITDDNYLLGGHAMVHVGYDLERKAFLSRNSFGTDWGMDGYCWIDFDYMTKELMDAWVYDIDSTIPPEIIASTGISLDI